MTENITPSIPELWDEDEAIERITHDGLLDTIEVMNESNWSAQRYSTHTNIFRLQSILRIRGSISIAKQLGKIKSPDTPANWITWAKRNGYDTSHLNPPNCTATDNHKEHELHSLIKKIFISLGRSSSNNDVWNTLALEADKKTYDKDEIIQEVKNYVIAWISRRGVEQNMKRKTFDNLLSKLRKQ